MMREFFVVVLLAGVLSGCATTQKTNPLVPQLQVRIRELERQLDLKGQQIEDLKYGVKDLSYELDRVKAQIKKKPYTPSARVSKSPGSKTVNKGKVIRVAASTEQVQTALKNAGYYSGVIDGKIGNQTKKAISKFQADNDLKSDGVVGKQTWEALESYL